MTLSRCFGGRCFGGRWAVLYRPERPKEQSPGFQPWVSGTQLIPRLNRAHSHPPSAPPGPDTGETPALLEASPQALRSSLTAKLLRKVEDSIILSTMIATSEIRRWSLQEKLALLEDLWTELSTDPDQVEVPDWHREVLDARQNALEAGTCGILDWDEAKAQISKARP